MAQPIYVVTTYGQPFLLNTLVTEWNGSGQLQMGLYTNPASLSDATTIGDLTEASYAGYARQTIASWAAPAPGPGAGFFTQAALVQFDNTSGGDITVYGYFVVDQTSGNLLWVQQDINAPVTIPNGFSYYVLPVLSAQSLF
jgi:hypothetical protein